MTVNTNLSALQSTGFLSESLARLTKSIARLSSGSKIVSPEDDPAGLAQSMKFDSQVTRTDAAMSDAQNVLSYQQTQAGYLQQVTKALDRMSELSVLANDPTKTAPDVAEYSQEFNQLKQYIDDVVGKTYNGISLFGTSTLSLPDGEGKTRAITAADLTNTLANTTLTAWGDNSAGAVSIPVGLKNVTAVAAGDGFSLALKSDGTVVGWGDNSAGELNIPAGLTNVTAIAAGDKFGMALKSDGTVVAWGDNGAGETTIPAGLTGVTAIAAGQFHALALTSAGGVTAWGLDSSGQTDVPPSLGFVTAISAGAGHSLALLGNGTVAAWGDNSQGQATVPSGLTGVTAISAGANHSLALKSDGTVVGWGANGVGETNIPAGLNDVIAVSAGYQHNLALKSDGTVVAWQDDTFGATDVPPGLSGVTQIAAGNQTGIALQGSSLNGTTVKDVGGMKYLIQGVANLTATVGAQIGDTTMRLDTLAIEKQNLAAASSRIKDVDVAAESTQFARNQILVSTATTMLSRAVTLPEVALKLLSSAVGG